MSSLSCVFSRGLVQACSHGIRVSQQPDHKLNGKIIVKAASPHVCYRHFDQASFIATSSQEVRKRPSINRELQSHIFFHEYKSGSVRHSDVSDSL